MNQTMLCAKFTGWRNGSTNSKFNRIWHVALLCVIVFMSSLGMFGQATGSFSGNVLDKSGSSIPGATVIATSQGTGLSRDVKTDTSGHYLIPLLPVGTYTLRVDARGFQSAESKNLRLQVDEARELDFRSCPLQSSPPWPSPATRSRLKLPIHLSAKSSPRSRCRNCP